MQSVRGLWLGYRLRQIREDLGLTLKEAAGYLDFDFSTFARYERCELPFRPEYVLALLNLYGVHDEYTRTELLQLAQDTGRLNLWRVDATAAPSSIDTAVPQPATSSLGAAGHTNAPVRLLQWLYGQATNIAVYSPNIIPDLLQTRAYETAVAGHIESPNHGHRHEYRRRREALARVPVTGRLPGPSITAVIDGHVLHRPIGGRKILAEQVEHLHQLAAEQNRIAIRILPTDRDFCCASNGGFTVLHLHTGFPPIALVDHLGGQMVLEGPWAGRYVTEFDRLCDIALMPAASRIQLAELTKDLTNQPDHHPEPAELVHD
ncbi:helix-turn-helix transcriptional regulator [Phytohabitans sp. ZYX-F-186]|uniref:Helix-turn-helix transcriptional regulator n=1 Tax=Phytohabitans maris TaxID=3071409 RepID=A0ABU0ZFY3_9ACTN|nr:helix-turn-helix transcriptional regulator [Phytohabitans sp. ZYX-F-186]MDQ7905966.1 helix-turn-helix transcriptional regulator [Phytohabitans sp. ZYX-F-186]